MSVTLWGFCAVAICVDASSRHRVVVSMPKQLSVQRTSGSLTVSYDLDSVRKVKVAVGEEMILGVKDEFRVYPKGEVRPSQFQKRFEGSINEKDNSNLLRSTETLNSVPDGIPEVGKRYVVEHDIILFETDVPAQHMWSPESSKNYKVLWEESLRAVK
jgi:hypothetical protein